MPANLARLAYEASLRSLDKQDEVLRDLRSRAGILLAASSLAVSFLGRTALEAQALLAVAALAAFITSIGASLYVLMPKAVLTVSLKGSAIYEGLYEFAHDPAEIHRRLTYDLDRFWEENDREIAGLFRVFRTATVAVTAEMILLLASVTDTLV